MQRRLLTLLLGLMGTVVLLLSFPLVTTIVDHARNQMFIEQRNDTVRLANLAANDDYETLRALMQRYSEKMEIESVVLARDGRLLTASDASPPTFSHDQWAQVSPALSGHRGDKPVGNSPWGSNPMLVAEPVIDDGAAVGAVVTLSPTRDLRADLALRLAPLVLCQLLALVACVYVARQLSNWVLGPVHMLDRVTHAVANGRLDLRLSEDQGPPELRRLSTSFNHMAGKVRTSLEQQRAFVADASHQLRNPLNALMLRLELLRAKMVPGSEDELQETQDEAHRLSALLDKMLTLATADHSDKTTQPVDLGALVHDRLHAWGAVAARRDVQIRHDMNGSVRVDADPTALGSAVDAVLDNALKYSPPATVVRVSLIDAEDVGIRIVDSGNGLPDHELARIGDRFWRSPQHQNVEGSGLGLSIVRQLLESSGGRLEVSRGNHQGLAITLWLPRQVRLS